MVRVRNHQPGMERESVVPRTYRGRAEVEVEVEQRVEVQRHVQTGNVQPGPEVVPGLCTRWSMYSEGRARSGVNTARSRAQFKAGEWKGHRQESGPDPDPTCFLPGQGKHPIWVSEMKDESRLTRWEWFRREYCKGPDATGPAAPGGLALCCLFLVVELCRFDLLLL